MQQIVLADGWTRKEWAQFPCNHQGEPGGCFEVQAVEDPHRHAYVWHRTIPPAVCKAAVGGKTKELRTEALRTVEEVRARAFVFGFGTPEEVAAVHAAILKRYEEASDRIAFGNNLLRTMRSAVTPLDARAMLLCIQAHCGDE